MKPNLSFLFKHAKTIALLTGLATLAMGFFAKDIQFNYQFFDFLPKASETRTTYETFQNQFEGPIQNIQIALVRSEGIFDTNFLTQSRQLARAIKKWPQVAKVYALTETKELVPGRNLPVAVPWIDVNHPENWPDAAQRLPSAPEVAGFLVARDLKSLCLHVVPENPDQAAEILKLIQQEMLQYNFEAYHLAGAVVGQQHFIEKMQTETLRFGAPAFLLVALFITLLFRSGRALLFPVVIIVGTALWVLGCMVLMGKTLGLLSSILIVIFIVVGVSDAVHFYAGLREAQGHGHPPLEAAKLTFQKIGWATLLTSLTTAVGFLSLMWVPVPALQDLGRFAGLGVLIAFFLTIVWFPAFFQNHTIKKQNQLWPNLWPKIAKSTTKFMLRNRRWFGAMPLLFVPIVAAGIQFLHTDNYFLEDLPEGDTHRTDFEFFEKNYGGIRRLELLIVPENGENLLDFEALQKWKTLHEVVCATLPCDQVASPYAAIAHWWKKTTYTDINTATPASYKAWQNRNQAFFNADAFQFVYNNEMGSAKFSLGLNDIGGAAMLKALNQMQTSHEWQLLGWQITPTGLAHFIDQSNVLVVKQIFGGFAIALVVVAVLMGLLFRSLKILSIALLANLVPLLIVAAFMGFAGIDLKISTAIIFSIVFGIAVDDTIHYLARYRWERKNGRGINGSLMRASVGTGKAIFHTTLILALGFGCLLLADFTSIYYIGLLIVLALFLALIVDLLVLPVWIKWVAREPRKKISKPL
jgi:predicted RND superfamily exporter protein